MDFNTGSSGQRPDDQSRPLYGGESGGPVESRADPQAVLREDRRRALEESSTSPTRSVALSVPRGVCF
ncbi:MAG: hypothetical protein LC740_15495 [Actinobacteria bacterium]|nr:hypothetical protein [Actinomycetota bacterium]